MFGWRLVLFEQIDDALSEWITGVLRAHTGREVIPALDPPAREPAGLGVNVYLLELVQEPRLASARRPFPQPALRYLVTAHGGDAREAHRLLGLLLQAATNRQALTGPADAFRYQMDVELEPVAAHVWSAFNVPPRPSFLLRVLVPQEWLAETAPAALELAALELAPVADWYGQLWQEQAGERKPFAGVSVEVSRPYRRVYSDRDGRFVLPAMIDAGPEPPRLRLLVNNRYEVANLPFPGPGTATEPVALTLVHLYGRLVDGQGQPLPNARVQLRLPAPDGQGFLVDRLVVSDADGRFLLPALPRQPQEKSVRITTGPGPAQAKTISSNGSATDPVEVIVDH